MELTSKEWKTILDIVYAINSSKNLTAMRTTFLKLIKELISYDFGIFDLCKTKDNKFLCFTDPIIDSKYDEKFEKEFVISYDNTYYSKSYSRWIHYEDEPVVYRETDFISNEMREKTEYFKFYLKPKNLIYSCGCELIAEKKNLGVVTLYREAQNGDYNDKELYILEILLPHLINLLSNKRSIDDFIIGDLENLEDKGLTNREMQVLNLIYKGHDNISISEILHISVNTVKKHIYNIFSKLEVNTRMQLISKYNMTDNNND